MFRLCTGLIPELETKISHVAKKKKKVWEKEKEDVFKELGAGDT